MGTERPLTLPALVKTKMAQQGKSVAEVYEGTFDRIKKTYPLDYYWIWTNEGWTWNGAFLIDETKADITLASSAIKKINAPFKLATSGWALGPENNRTMFDSILPIDFPMSAINQNTGETPIDPALTIPQLWVNRVKRDSNDAFKYDCTGLMGIHWRTREIGANISALSQLSWNQGNWTAEQFYLDWAPLGQRAIMIL